MGKHKANRERIAFLEGLALDTDTRNILVDAIDNFEGDATILYAALGSLIFAKAFGWQGLRVTMSSVTFAKYQEILGVEFRKVCPERTPLSANIRGIRLVDAFGKFWQALSGGVVRATEGKMIESNIS